MEVRQFADGCDDRTGTARAGRRVQTPPGRHRVPEADARGQDGKRARGDSRRLGRGSRALPPGRNPVRHRSLSGAPPLRPRSWRSPGCDSPPRTSSTATTWSTALRGTPSTWRPTCASCSQRSRTSTCASCCLSCSASARRSGPATATRPAAKRYHQAYRHGLLEHSLTVAQAVSAISATFPGIDRDVAVTGALLHDIGKLDAYDVVDGERSRCQMTDGCTARSRSATTGSGARSRISTGSRPSSRRRSCTSSSAITARSSTAARSYPARARPRSCT